jgi:hypothetical protein
MRTLFVFAAPQGSSRALRRRSLMSRRQLQRPAVARARQRQLAGLRHAIVRMRVKIGPQLMRGDPPSGCRGDHENQLSLHTFTSSEPMPYGRLTHADATTEPGL